MNHIINSDVYTLALESLYAVLSTQLSCPLTEQQKCRTAAELLSISGLNFTFLSKAYRNPIGLLFVSHQSRSSTGQCICQINQLISSPVSWRTLHSTSATFDLNSKLSCSIVFLHGCYLSPSPLTHFHNINV